MMTGVVHHAKLVLLFWAKQPRLSLVHSPLYRASWVSTQLNPEFGPHPRRVEVVCGSGTARARFRWRWLHLWPRLLLWFGRDCHQWGRVSYAPVRCLSGIATMVPLPSRMPQHFDVMSGYITGDPTGCPIQSRRFAAALKADTRSLASSLATTCHLGRS